MLVLEIGCGVGRVMRPLALIFGGVHGVDVSEEMARRAETFLSGLSNVSVFVNNGADLSVVGENVYDFVFSFLVFQHISSKAIISSYVREVARVIRPGGLFKFQVQGATHTTPEPLDTWVGVPYSVDEAKELARSNGFECRHHHGEGTQYFWLWFFRTE